MKVIVFGAGGIIGQYMRRTIPSEVDASFLRSSDLDMTNTTALLAYLDGSQPDVIVNLAGENRVDVVEATPVRYEAINVEAPKVLVRWCDQNNSHLVQVSTQGVFSGNDAPYQSHALVDPVTRYGFQKANSEFHVQKHDNWTIARLTFVLGIRPMQIGRTNPIESMLTTQEQLQVNDRWFSPCFAKDGAKQLWKLAKSKPHDIFHIGTPVRTSRYEIACSLMQGLGEGIGYKIIPVSHNHFPGIAPRPKDTTWADNSLYNMSYVDGIRDIIKDWNELRTTS
jgi:dTDP-4-dehydrorhamnose reductase